MLPRVILHIGVSLDGRIDWGCGDIGLYYELAATWPADAMLSGSETMLAAYRMNGGNPDEDEGPLEAPEKVPGDARQLLVVVDSRGRIRQWNFWRRQPYWRDVLALCSRATPRTTLDYLRQKRVEFIIAGDERVDLRAALEELNAQYGVKVIRVDSGGILNGVLLRAGLVDEVSVIVDPCLTGGTTSRSMFVAPDLTSADGIIALKLLHVENVRGDSVWLRYEVVK
jgi:2,5-diamino-6-(ribosylamino)-4(3H)-pyrimidinone 5'-phosphate reductase